MLSDSFSQLLKDQLKYQYNKEITLIGHLSSQNNKTLIEDINQHANSTPFQKRWDILKHRHISHRKASKCGASPRNSLESCINNLNLDELLLYDIRNPYSNIDIVQLKHVPSNISNSKSTNANRAKLLLNVGTQSAIVKSVKELFSKLNF